MWYLFPLPWDLGLIRITLTNRMWNWHYASSGQNFKKDLCNYSWVLLSLKETRKVPTSLWDRYYRKILSPPGERANSRDKGSLKGAHLSNYRYNKTLGVDWTSLTILTILVLNTYPLTLIETPVNATGKLPVQPCQSHNPQIMRTNKQSCYIRCYFSLVYRNIMKCDFQTITFT